MKFKKFIALICAFSFVFSNLINVSAHKAVKAVKVTLLGDSGVGKTALLQKVVNGKVEENISSTEGINFMHKECDNNLYLNFWDTSGNESLLSTTKTHCRNANIVVIAVNRTRTSIEESVDAWMKIVETICPDAKRILVATKIDAEGTDDNSALIEKKATEHHMELYRVSATSGAGMEDFENALIRAATEIVAARNVAEVGTAKTTVTTKTRTPTPLLVAGIVTGITAAVGLIATMVHLAKSRLSANRLQPKLT
ncbi:MAG: GTP-binding protein [Oscillospiraceae bacterium]|jgi:Ras-related protein Rab-1A/Rab family protein|nr:GTP-binding protein [Oscillospiraceae bacterium]